MLLRGSARKTLVFAHRTMLHLAYAFKRNNHEKSMFWASKILLGPSQDHPKSSSGGPKTHKNRPRAIKNAARPAKVPPYIGSAQEQILTPGLLTLLFRTIFLTYFFTLQTLPNSSQNPSQNHPKTENFDVCFPSFFCVYFGSIF